MKAHGSTLMSWSLSSSFFYVSFCHMSLKPGNLNFYLSWMCFVNLILLRVSPHLLFFHAEILARSWGRTDRLALLSIPWILCLWRGQEHKETLKPRDTTSIQLVEHGHAQVATLGLWLSDHFSWLDRLKLQDHLWSFIGGLGSSLIVWHCASKPPSQGIHGENHVFKLITKWSDLFWMRFSALGIEPFLLVHSRAVVLPTHHCNAHPFEGCIWIEENLELSRDVPLQRGVRQEGRICAPLCVIHAFDHRLRNGISSVQHVGWESCLLNRLNFVFGGAILNGKIVIFFYRVNSS